MTHRVLTAYAKNGSAVVRGTPDGTMLRALIYGEEPISLPLVPQFCDANALTSVRNISGTTQSQNSTVTNYAQGYVKSQGVAVSRPVAVYRRDTKELLVTGLSDAGGFFRLAWKGYSGKVTVVIFEEETVGYNAKVFDLIVTN